MRFTQRAIGVISSATAVLVLSASAEPSIEKIDLFEIGDPGYKRFHIPGVVVTAKGTALAWCEARKNGSDWDEIDILLRRSTDDGKTWSKPQNIAEVDGPKEKNPFALELKHTDPDSVTYNNPVLIADRGGTVHMLFCLEYMRCFYQCSTDDGITWSKPVEITKTFEAFRDDYDWKVLATGPNHSIQLDNGRLVVPVWLSTGTGGNAHRPSVTATIYSDDGGGTWKAGEIAVPNSDTFINPNETVAVQLKGGSVMLNVRSESKAHRRIVVTSPDGATDWSEPQFVEELVEPICMGGLVRYDHDGETLLLFSHPDNLEGGRGGKPEPGKSRARKNLSIHVSDDEGETWSAGYPVEPGWSAYSDLAVTPEGTILCFYGRSEEAHFAGDRLTVARITLEELRGLRKENSSPEVVDIRIDRQLFFDDYLIDKEKTKGVQRTLNRPHTIERVLKPERPSEALGFIFYCSVVDDGGVAKLFHGSYDAEKGKHFALATSEDGIHWERPDLGLTEYQGDRRNNLLPLHAVEASVFLDPVASPGKRYRLLYSRHWPDPATAGVYLASSPDGIHWTENDTRLLPFVPDSQHCGLWDSDLGKYVIYTRAWNPRRVIVRAEVDDIEQPWKYDISAEPLAIWGDEKVPTLSLELPTVMTADDRDPPGVELYTNTVVRYEGQYLAFPATYQTFTGPEWKDRALNGNDGTFDIQFASSRDGIEWTRLREPYLSAGFHDGLDLRLVSMGQGVIRRGRELHQYFVGWPHTHGRPVVWDTDLEDREEWLKKDLGGIYRATTRVDGFVSMDAGYPGGSITTKPFRFSGDRLRLNLHAGGSGGVKVALLDAEGEAIPGFSVDDCAWINADEIDHVVSWTNGSDVGQLADESVRLHFMMRNARLFAFEFGNSKKS